ncbi:aldo/keto reductase [Pedobacter sp. WC2501]|uniref:aldo/keto reductase n=1 Tax=Pedobacter sp. WC2501 TaxID=3461400 RepID=UPI0040465B82
MLRIRLIKEPNAHPLIALEDLSKIGIGTYRMSVSNNDHIAALKAAMEYGGTLIDTASNYQYGKSEALIGSFIKENPQKDVFVITKAGYILPDIDHRFINSLLKKGMGNNEIINYNGTFHCLHPDFILKRIKQSLKKLNRKFIDGFLLHNPEYFLYANPGMKTEYYVKIKKAFEVLEDLVKKQVIRYYGVSSNTLPFRNEHCFATSMPMLLSLSNEVSKSNHFKLVQFPYNLLEHDAKLPMVNGQSLISLLKENGIKSFANRPLNINTAGGLIRLAYSQNNITSDFDQQADHDLQHFLNLIQGKLNSKFGPSSLTDFEPVNQFISTWKAAASHQGVQHLYERILKPFLDFIYSDAQIKDNLTNQLFKYSLAYASKNMQLKTGQFLEGLSKNQGIHFENNTELATLACRSYLNDGIDHILVGLTKKEYVDQFKTIF